jgi:hypothetical protein
VCCAPDARSMRQEAPQTDVAPLADAPDGGGPRTIRAA